MRLTDYEVRTFTVPINPPISDSQYELDVAGVAYLELEVDAGEMGVGFGGASPSERPEAMAERYGSILDDLIGESPVHLVNRARRPRGGEYGVAHVGGYDQAVDVARWDL